MSDGNQPPIKRKRAEGSPEVSEPYVCPLERSDIWYDDGNIILQAESYQFKVYRGVLAQRSSVFKDMFSLPQPPLKDSDLVEGCPVVHLSDGWIELRYILRSILRRGWTDGKPPLSVVSAFLSLGRKYDIPNLRAEGKRSFYQEFPVTLEDRDKLTVWTYIDVYFRLDNPNLSQWMKLAVIARREGLISTLPYILYKCCCIYSAKEILRGTPASESPGSSMVYLASEDQVACIAGHRLMIEAQARTAYKWLYSQETLSPLCTTCNDCDSSRRAQLIEKFTPLPKICALDDWEEAGHSAQELCKFCAKTARKQHEQGRRTFWKALPVLLGLPQWIKLLKERDDSE
ncbi:hypothetical protein FIBSPDRAFT_835403 [Athelia psychrophila]|uniref:BTB domain-containing protein n=1 Tax=Athelia psychrophila TaxID=1759441 RepID=A0A166BZ21_9AGAM|nr:hypothetical protein FIBSPDRAFT_835403 [Fibularhizoctonia sp. CBS 109695]